MKTNTQNRMHPKTLNKQKITKKEAYKKKS